MHGMDLVVMVIGQNFCCCVPGWGEYQVKNIVAGKVFRKQKGILVWDVLIYELALYGNQQKNITIMTHNLSFQL